MAKLLNFLSRTSVLIISFIIIMVVGFSFSFFEPHIGGPLLDMQMNGADAINRLNEMSPHHRTMHIIITATLDSIYPLANFCFFAGLSTRLAGAWRKFAIMPACIYVTADFVENGVQILALRGSENLLSLKDFITPIKFYAFGSAAIIVILLVIITFIKWIAKREKPNPSR